MGRPTGGNLRSGMPPGTSDLAAPSANLLDDRRRGLMIHCPHHPRASRPSPISRSRALVHEGRRPRLRRRRNPNAPPLRNWPRPRASSALAVMHLNLHKTLSPTPHGGGVPVRGDLAPLSGLASVTCQRRSPTPSRRTTPVPPSSGRAPRPLAHPPRPSTAPVGMLVRAPNNSYIRMVGTLSPRMFDESAVPQRPTTPGPASPPRLIRSPTIASACTRSSSPVRSSTSQRRPSRSRP